MQFIVPTETTVTLPRRSWQDSIWKYEPNPSGKASREKSAVGVRQLLPGQWEGRAGTKGLGVGTKKDMPGIFDVGRENSKTHRLQE